MRPELHHVPILDRPGLALVRVDDDVTGAWLAGDGLPLDPGREARSTVSGEPRRLELLDDALLRERVAEELEAAALLVVRERLVSLPEPERRAVVRRVRDLRDDLVAAGHDGSEIAVAEACDLDRSWRASREARAPRSSRRSAPCRHGPRRAAPGGTSRRRRPRAPRHDGCSCGRRAHPTARA